MPDERDHLGNRRARPRRDAQQVGPAVRRAMAHPRLHGCRAVYLALPILVMIAFSFNDPPGTFNFVWGEFSLAAWQNPFGRPGLQTAIATSLGIAASRPSSRRHSARSSRSPCAATTSAAGARRTCSSSSRWRRPRSCSARSLLTLFVGRSGPSVADRRAPLPARHPDDPHRPHHVQHQLRGGHGPARMQGFPRHLEEAAMDLGANEWTTFWKVTFPLILPGILAGALLAFSLSIDDFVITNFTAATATRSRCGSGSHPQRLPLQVHVIGTIVFVGAVGLVVLNTLWERRGAAAIREPAAAEVGTGGSAMVDRPPTPCRPAPPARPCRRARGLGPDHQPRRRPRRGLLADHAATASAISTTRRGSASRTPATPIRGSRRRSRRRRRSCFTASRTSSTTSPGCGSTSGSRACCPAGRGRRSCRTRAPRRSRPRSSSPGSRPAGR